MTKTAVAVFTHYYEWQIKKVVDNPGPITLLRGERVEVQYTVMVDLLSVTDSDWQVKGSITIANSHPSRVAELTPSLDNAGGISDPVDCGGATSVPATDSLGCSYDEVSGWNDPPEGGCCPLP